MNFTSQLSSVDMLSSVVTLGNSEVEQEGLKLLFKAVDYKWYVGIKHPNLSIPSVYAQIIALQCTKLAPAVQNEEEKKEYDSIPTALLLVCTKSMGPSIFYC